MHDEPMTPAPDDANNPASAVASELRVVVSQLKRRLRDQARPDELTHAQTAALVRLDKVGPATVSGLARAEGIRPQSMAPIVAVLEQRGLIEGVADPADGRQTLFSLTAACQQRLREDRAARQDWLSRHLQAHLSPAELDELMRAIRMLRRFVDD